MTTITLQIDDNHQDLVEAFKTFLANFKNISFSIEREETKEKILDNLSKVYHDIKDGTVLKSSRPIEDLYREFEDDRD
jgi:hypothetical protein